MVGNVACGKTTLLQALDNQPLEYKKTQSIEVIAGNIDSPGEYLERRVNLQNLLVTSVDTDLVLFLMDPTQDRYMYSGGQAMAFPVPVGSSRKRIWRRRNSCSRRRNCWSSPAQTPSSS